MTDASPAGGSHRCRQRAFPRRGAPGVADAGKQLAGCFERVEPGGAGSDGSGEAGFHGTGGRHDRFCSLAAGTGRADAGCPVGFLAQPGDLVVLDGEPGQGLVAEDGELADRGV